MYNFIDYQNVEVTIQNPFICKMEEVISYNASNKIAICSLKDDSGTIIVGFLYKKFAELLSDRHVKNRLPFKISVISGKIQQKGSKLTFEIYQCIFEKDFLINSSSLSSHSYCEMSTYLSTHIHAYSLFNPFQIFGNIYHDYLMYVFEDEDLLKLPVGDPLIPIKIKTAFEQAIYRNWRSLAAFNVNEQAYLDYFIEYYGKKEVEFIHYELEKLRNFGDDYSFQAEIMARSRNFGLQGRVDRILWNQTKNAFTLYETKTGRTSFASENTAKFQLMAYSLILNEFYSKQLEELLLEYPRNDLEDRLKVIEFDGNQIVRLVNMRNQIWAISIGRRPNEGPFKKCSSKCFQKDVCSFYCLRSFLTKNCLDCERCNYHPILFNQAEFEEFRRVNVYFDWFYQFLEMEYLKNQDLLLELGLPAKDREALGNCFANVVISNVDKTLGLQQDPNSEKISSTSSRKFWVTFSRGNSDISSQSFINTRMNSSDFVLITPQNYRPLTLQSIPASVYEIQKNHLILEVSSDFFSMVSNFIQGEIFRIDIMTSNRIINTEKSALDAFLRVPYLLGNDNLKQIRKHLTNLISTEPPKYEEIDANIKSYLNNKQYNANQIKAISQALSFTDLLLIQGPPGTGKTTVITEIVNQLVQKLQSVPNFIQRERPKQEKPKPEIEINTSGTYYEEGEEPKPPKPEEKKEQVPEFKFDNLITTKKILLTAFTNRAVDTLTEMLLKKYPNIDVLRIGSELSISLAVKPKSLDAKSKKEVKFSNGENIEVFSPKIAHELIQNATVIATTCLGANSVLLQNVEFDYVVVDEAGQVIEPAALIPLLKAKKVILVGDDAQLPPISVKEKNPLLDSEYFADKNYLQGFHGTILQYQDENKTTIRRKDIFLKELNELGIELSDTLSVSLFQRLKRKLKGTKKFVLLTEQYRMHQTISNFISHRFYDDKLIPGVINNRSIGNQTLSKFYLDHSFQLPTKLPKSGNFARIFAQILDPNLPMIFLDTKNIDATDSKSDKNFDEMVSKFNEKEAQILSKIISTFISEYLVANQDKKESNLRDFLENIGIITPYRAQVRRIRSYLYETFQNDKVNQEYVSKHVLIDTVDKFQGKESEIIFISLVDSNPDKELSSLYSELRRMNVSMSRAKTKLVFIGNSDTFISKSDKKPRSILDYFDSKPNEPQELSNDSNIMGTSLKSTELICRFFTDLVNYIQTQKGYVILDENMILEDKK